MKTQNSTRALGVFPDNIPGKEEKTLGSITGVSSSLACLLLIIASAQKFLSNRSVTWMLVTYPDKWWKSVWESWA